LFKVSLNFPPIYPSVLSALSVSDLINFLVPCEVRTESKTQLNVDHILQGVFSYRAELRHYMKHAFAGTLRNSCGAQDNDKRNELLDRPHVCVLCDVCAEAEEIVERQAYT